MKYLDSNGLQKLRDADSERMNRLYRPIECGLWTRSESSPNVSIYPVGGTKVNPTVEFMFKETPPASGTKSPSNPSTIEGINTVSFVRTGKNIALYYPNYSTTISGVTISIDNDNVITLNGTSTIDSDKYFQLLSLFPSAIRNYTFPDKTKCSLSLISISGTQTKDSIRDKSFSFQLETIYKNVEPIGHYGYDTVYPGYMTKTWGIHGRTLNKIGILIFGKASFDNYKFKIQCEIEDSVTIYENPKIDEWTIQLGNTYYGGTIDVTSGLMTVTYNGIVFDGTERWLSYGNIGSNYRHIVWLNDLNAPLALSGHGIYARCTHFSHSYTYNAEFGYFFVGVNNTDPIVSFDDAGDTPAYATTEAWQEWVAEEYAKGTPLTVAYRIEPYTVQLTPVQISSLLQKDRYTPRKNTFYTDASNSISVEYLKSPVKASYDIQQAILAQGGV